MMANLPYKARELLWIASSKDDISAFPKAARSTLGFSLMQVQIGETPENATPLPELGSGVMELKAQADGNAHRVVYAVKLQRGVYVLDAFVKKSKKGKEIPREIKERIKQRYAEAVRRDRE